MKILELFAGSRSFSNVAEKMGLLTFSTDIEAFEKIDLVKDIMEISTGDIPFKPDIIWASPPCTCFSVASIGKHWSEGYIPKTEAARQAIKIVERTIELIKEITPKFYFIENPRGMLRKLPIMQDLPRVTVTYCQYGDKRMKPTDIWTNLSTWKPRQMCKNGNDCHEAAPRGSSTGTQGIKGSFERSKVPEELCQEIISNALRTKLLKF